MSEAHLVSRNSNSGLVCSGNISASRLEVKLALEIANQVADGLAAILERNLRKDVITLAVAWLAAIRTSSLWQQ
jgi:hypothetical protein